MKSGDSWEVMRGGRDTFGETKVPRSSFCCLCTLQPKLGGQIIIIFPVLLYSPYIHIGDFSV